MSDPSTVGDIVGAGATSGSTLADWLKANNVKGRTHFLDEQPSTPECAGDHGRAVEHRADAGFGS
jgi:hypothetical protein